MSKKNKAAAAAQVENVNVVSMPEVAQVENVNAPEVSKADQLKSEAERLLAEAKAAKEAAKQAAKEAKEAAKKAKALTSRPVRKSFFEVRVSDNIQDAILEGEFVTKSDVHYCAEKAAIDAIAQLREDNGYDEHVYLIFKVNKSEECPTRQLISMVYLDEETNQIVID